MNRQYILLPIIEAGDDQKHPDWDFMEGYIREREQVLISRYLKFREDCGRPPALEKQGE